MFVWLSVLVLVLVLGQSSRHRDDRSTISKRQPKHVHRQQRWVVGPVNSCDAPVVFIDTVRAPKLDIRQSQPKGKKNETFVICAKLQLRQDSSARDLGVAIGIASLLPSLPRHACADRPMVEALETFPMDGDDDNGKSTECCLGDIYVR